MARLLSTNSTDNSTISDGGNTSRTPNLFGPSTTISSSSSVGALCTEEWMPLSPFPTTTTPTTATILPSFMEMVMIDSVHVSFVSLIRTITQQVQTILHNELLRHNQNTTNNNRNRSISSSSFVLSSPSSHTSNNSYQRRVFLRANNIYTILCTSIHWFRIRKLVLPVTRLLERTLKTYGSEIRYLFLYYIIQRQCLLQSSAKVEEMIYHTRRVKNVRIQKQQQPRSDTTINKFIANDENDYNNNNNNNTRHQTVAIPITRYRLVPLERVDKIRLALLTTLGLYIREKIHDWYVYQQSINDEENSCATTATKKQMETKSQHQCFNSSSSTSGITIKQLMCYYLIKCYPFVIASIDIYSVWFQMQYLLGRSLHYDITSFLLGHIVRRVTQDDIKQQKSNSSNSSTTTTTKTTSHQQRLVGIMTRDVHHPIITDNNNSNNTKPKTSVTISDTSKNVPSITTTTTAATTTILQNSIVHAGVLSLFVLGWMTKVRTEWMEYCNHLHQQRQRQVQQHNHRLNQNDDEDNLDDDDDENNLVHITEHIIIPPPPHPTATATTTNAKTQKMNSNNNPCCSLCGNKQRIHPTAISLSGYVFCLSCIKPYIKQHGSCPITRIPCTETDLIRLYEPTSTAMSIDS